MAISYVVLGSPSGRGSNVAFLLIICAEQETASSLLLHREIKSALAVLHLPAAYSDQVADKDLSFYTDVQQAYQQTGRPEYI